jgi:hypothetical protein
MKNNHKSTVLTLVVRLILLTGLQVTLVPAFAADLYWEGGAANIGTNGDGLGAGGIGTWSTTIVNWDAGSGVPHTNWVNANLDNPNFGGTATTAKTITTSSGLTNNQIKFTTTGYTIGATVGSGPIVFGGVYDDNTPAIDTSAGTPVSGNFSATFASKITGTINGGLVIKDVNNVTTPGTSGRLYLNTGAGNDFSGNIVVLSGNLHVLSSLGNATNKVYLKGGALFGSAGAAITYSVARDVVVTTDSAIGLNATVANVIMDLASNKTITGSANLTRYNGAAGNGELRLSGDMSGYSGTFTNTGTTGTLTIQTTATSAGGWVLTGGTIKLNTNNDTHIANGAGKPNLEIDGGVLNMNGRSETINGLVGTGGYVENDLSGSNSVLTVGDANATASFSGGLRNNNGTGGTLALVKIGNGIQTLAGTNQCSRITVAGGTLALSGAGIIQGTDVDVQSAGTFDVTASSTGAYLCPSNHVLSGNGTIAGSVTNQGTFSPGESIGVLNVSSNVDLDASGTAWMEVNNAAATNDLLIVGGTLTCGGTLVITNVSGTAYTNNQVLKLFNAASYDGAFNSIVFPGTSGYDASRLTVDGTIKVTSVIPTTPTNLTYSVSGGSITLSWPAGYTGWRLVAQTNNLGTNWATVPGSTTVHSMTLPIDLSKGSVFYRMAYP